MAGGLTKQQILFPIFSDYLYLKYIRIFAALKVERFDLIATTQKNAKARFFAINIFFPTPLFNYT